jgi:hypothetical protein
MIIGSLQAERSQHTEKDLALASGVARLLLASALRLRTLIVGMTGVQLLLHDFGDESQRHALGSVLQRLQVQTRQTLAA